MAMQPARGSEALSNTTIDTTSVANASSSTSDTRHTTPVSGQSSTITPPPLAVLNTCSYYNTEESQVEWNSPWCSVYAGTVDLVFWPTNDNYSYPATSIDTRFNYTYTSPSVYMIVNTLYGSNPCGLLGPSTSRHLFSFDLTQVSTFIPYLDEDVKSGWHPRQLELSDLDTSCSGSYDVSSLQTETHPTQGDEARCNPRLDAPADITKWGYPYWKHCNMKNGRLGLFDPPYAVSPIHGFADPTTAAKTQTTTTQDASTGAIPTPDVASSTATDTAPAASTTALVDGEQGPASQVAVPTSSPGNIAVPTNSPSNVAAQASGDLAATVNTGYPQLSGGSDTDPAGGPGTGGPGTYMDASTTAFSQEIVSLGTTHMDASTTTFSQQIVSLGTSGLEIAAYGDGLSTTYRIPIGDSGSAASGVSVATYAGQILTLGGSAATLTDIAVVLPSSATPTIAASSVRVGSTSGANPGGQGGGSGLETPTFKNATAQTSADHSVQTASASHAFMRIHTFAELLVVLLFIL
ncbi:hypothetical protein SCAR479_02607 [Seiridium cardinale]|uniref:Uncharacterized protein n=1 Tax=Seiridium cardinale TaxID=138064 RepID=A0ABR2Y374_9PEZI